MERSQHAETAPTRSSATRRTFSVVLVAIHLAVFLFGGALLGESSARAATRRAVIATASTSSSDAPTVTTATDGQLEAGTRTRGARGDRSGGAPPLAWVVPSTTPAIAPPRLIGSREWRSASRERRPAPSAVHGARGPPPAR